MSVEYVYQDYFLLRESAQRSIRFIADNFFNENLLDTLTLSILLQEGIFQIIV